MRFHAISVPRGKLNALSFPSVTDAHNLTLTFQTRFNVESESIFTQLVFEHSLRIRLRSDALDKKDDKKDDKKKKDKKGKKDTKGKSPSTATPASGETQTQSPTDTETDTLVESEEATPEGGHAKAKTGHLVGKINNLITTDSNTIQNSYQAIALCKISCLSSSRVFLTIL